MIHWIVFLVIKLIFVSVNPLTFDENYYWVWSQRMALSYFDHPPMVAWLFKLGTFLPEWMLKWPAVLLGHGALYLWDRFLLQLGWTEEQRIRWFYLAMMAPLVGMTTLVLTPDVPLLFFQVLATVLFIRALEKGRARDYSFFGLSLGLGFCAKYLMALMVPCFIFYLAYSKRWKEVKWTYLLLVILFGFVGSLPVLYWNYQHDWASFEFQFHHGVGKKVWNPIWPWEYLGSLIILIMPFYFKSLWVALKEQRHKLMLSLGFPLILFLVLVNFRSKVEANWSQLAFLPLLSLMAFYDQSTKKAKGLTIFWCLMAGVFSFFLRQPWSQGCNEKLCEAQRFQGLIEPSKHYSPFYVTSYQMASYLWYQKKTPVFKLLGSNRKDVFDSFPEAKPQVSPFYVAKTKDIRFPDWVKEEGYQAEVVLAVDSELEVFKVFR